MSCAGFLSDKTMFEFGEWFAAQMYMKDFSVQYFVKCVA